MASFFEQALDVYRDVEVAKRSQPQVVQAVEHTQTPFPRNTQAPAEPVKSKPAAVQVGGLKVNKTLLYASLGLLGVALAFKFMRR